MTGKLGVSLTGSTTVGVPVATSSDDSQDTQGPPGMAWPTLGTVPDLLGSPWLCEGELEVITPEPWTEAIPEDVPTTEKDLDA